MNAYIYGGITAIILLLAGTSYVMYNNWTNAVNEKAIVQQELVNAKAAIETQKDTIEDLQLQQRIVARELKDLQLEMNGIERENDTANKELDDLLTSIPSRDTTEAERALNEGLFKTIDRLEKSGRK